MAAETRAAPVRPGPRVASTCDDSRTYFDMESLGPLVEVVIALGAALVLGLAAARVRQSPIVGYLLAGVLVGPGGLGLLHAMAEARILAEVGVALLLFTIGLEFTWPRLRALGSTTVLGGTLQIAATAAMGAAAALLLGVPLAPANVFGAIIALSSTAVVFRVLVERAEIDAPAGRAAVGVLLVQDVAAVPLMVLVPVLAGAGGLSVIGARLGGAAIRAILLVAALVLIGRAVLPRLFAVAAAGSREIFIILAITFCLAATWAAGAWELSPVLGSFAAGVVLAGSPYATQVRADIGPLRSGFVAFFFVSIGMLADIGWIARHLPLVIGVVGAILIGKSALVAGALRLVGQPTRTAGIVGVTLAHIGELSFVLADLGRGHGLLDPDEFQLIVSASVVTLLLTPYAIAGARRWLGPPPAPLPTEAGVQRAVRGGDHVVIIGCGPTGRRVGGALAEVGTPYRFVDLNARAVRLAEARGEDAMFGDATQAEVLLEAGLRRAMALVVTVPDPAAAATIVGVARSLRSDLSIVARSRYAMYAGEIANAGADVTVNEEELMGERLAAVTLRLVGMVLEAMERVEH